jgi:hypothetical protein
MNRTISAEPDPQVAGRVDAVLEPLAQAQGYLQ